MLTKVEVRTTLGMLLVLPLDDVSNGYVIADIQGLDPVKATLVSSSSAQLDGAQYQASRRETRNILMKIGLEPDYTTTSVRDLRMNLYDFFMPKTEISLRFFDDVDDAWDIVARVESFEAPLFSREPQVDLSLICFDPDFLDLTPVVIEGNTVSDSTETLVEYDGTVETGIVLVLTLDRDLTEFTVYHRTPDDVIKSLDFAAELLDGDVVTINTNVGSKGITLLRSSTLSSLLYGMSPQSTWIELLKGDNNIRVYAVGAAIPYTITYTTRYGGL